MAGYKIATWAASGHMACWSEFLDGTRGFGYVPKHYREFASRDDAENELATIPRDDATELIIIPLVGAA